MSSLVVLIAVACSATPGGQLAGSKGKKVCEVPNGPRDAGLGGAVDTAVYAASGQLGIEAVVRQSTVPDVGPFPSDRCDLIVASGYQESQPVFTTASRFLRQRFLIADDWFDFNSASDLTRPNVSVLAFESDQASFLAGYVAAAVSANHVVGEYGSVNIPTVDLALNGFLAGALAYGEDFRTHVQVLGWNGKQGQFVGNDLDQNRASSITSGLIRAGAHVIFGAAGKAIVGSAAAVERRPSTYLIGMYVDGYAIAPRYANRWLTCVVFNMRAPMLAAIKAAVTGTSPGLYVGTVANGGVRLAPFRRLAHLVPKAVLAKLPVLKNGLGQGWISTDPAAYVPLEKETGNGNG